MALELRERRKGVLPGIFDVIVRLLLPVCAEYAIYCLLRASALVAVSDLPAVGRDARGDGVQVGVVRIVVGIDQQGLSGFHVSHLRKITVGELQKFGFRHFVSLARYGDVELRFPYPAVLGAVFHEVFCQLLGGRPAECPECAEVAHLDEPGGSFRDFPLIVADGMEVRASG